MSSRVVAAATEFGELLANVEPADRSTHECFGVQERRVHFVTRLQIGCSERSNTSGNGFIFGLISPRSTMVGADEVPPFPRLGLGHPRGRVHSFLGSQHDLDVLAAPLGDQRSHRFGERFIGVIRVEDRAHEAFGDLGFCA